MLAEDEITPEQRDFLQTILNADPNLLTVIAGFALIIVTILITFALYSIRKAGMYSPPVVTVTVTLGVVTLSAVAALVIRPELDALVAVIGTALGGLSAAVTLAFERRGEHGDAADDSVDPDEQDSGDAGDPGVDSSDPRDGSMDHDQE